MRKFFQPILQFVVIIIIGSIVILGVSFLTNKWKKPDIIIQKDMSMCWQNNTKPPCKMSVWSHKFNRKKEENEIPDFNEYLLDGEFCSKLPFEKSQTTYGFEGGETFIEIYKLPWTKSDNFSDRINFPKETFNLEQFLTPNSK